MVAATAGTTSAGTAAAAPRVTTAVIIERRDNVDVVDIPSSILAVMPRGRIRNDAIRNLYAGCSFRLPPRHRFGKSRPGALTLGRGALRLADLLRRVYIAACTNH
jgi:hypothetical protein